MNIKQHPDYLKVKRMITGCKTPNALEAIRAFVESFCDRNEKNLGLRVYFMEMEEKFNIHN